jgi:hypothetical protein
MAKNIEAKIEMGGDGEDNRKLIGKIIDGNLNLCKIIVVCR